MKNKFVDTIQRLIEQTDEESDLKLKVKELIDKEEKDELLGLELSSFIDLAIAKIQKNDAHHVKEGIILTEIHDFDVKFGGLMLGELIVIGGRPTMGKRNLLSWLSLRLAQKMPTLFFSFEITKEMLTSLMISSCSNKSVHEIELNQLDAQDQLNVIKKIGEFEDAELYITEECSESISRFIRFCENAIETKGIKIIAVDYLQLMRTSNPRTNREKEIEYIMGELKKFVKKHQVTLILNSQLARSPDLRTGSKRPILSDLRDSGSIEQLADKIILLYRPDYYGLEVDENNCSTHNMLELIVAKNNYGTTGSVKLSTMGQDIVGYNDTKSADESIQIFHQRKADLNKREDWEGFQPF